jgi:hypothetical protein
MKKGKNLVVRGFDRGWEGSDYTALTAGLGREFGSLYFVFLYDNDTIN